MTGVYGKGMKCLAFGLSKDYYTNLDVPITIYLCRPYMLINALGPIKTCI